MDWLWNGSKFPIKMKWFWSDTVVALFTVIHEKGNKFSWCILPISSACEHVPASVEAADCAIYDDKLDVHEAHKILTGTGDIYTRSTDAKIGMIFTNSFTPVLASVSLRVHNVYQVDVIIYKDYKNATYPLFEVTARSILLFEINTSVTVNAIFPAN